MNSQIYTKSETTVKKYTVGQAFESAKRYLKTKGYSSFCTNAISKYDLSDKITLAELNKIRDQIIDDTKFWD